MRDDISVQRRRHATASKKEVVEMRIQRIETSPRALFSANTYFTLCTRTSNTSYSASAIHNFSAAHRPKKIFIRVVLFARRPSRSHKGIKPPIAALYVCCMFIRASKCNSLFFAALRREGSEIHNDVTI